MTPSETTAQRPASTLMTVVTAVGIMLVAANLRPAVVTVAPLIDDISADQGFTGAMAGLLTTLPLLFFGIASPLAPRLAARFGIERAIFGSLILLIAAILLRFIPNATALFVGSALVGAAIGIGNVLLPALIKRDFAHRSGLMTGLYSMTLSGGAAVAVAVTVPIDDALDQNWRLTITSWVLLVLLAVIAWIPQLSRVHTITYTPTETVWRNRIAWAITVFMGAQSLVFYSFTAWLPALLTDQGYSRASAGTVLALGQLAGLVGSLVVPMVAARYADQRAATFVVIAVSVAGLVGLLATDRWAALWSMLLGFGPGASISLAVLFMVLRSRTAAQTGQVSGMSQSIGYILAAFGPIAVGALHDATGSWNIAFGVLGVGLLAQSLAASLAARNVRMAP